MYVPFDLVSVSVSMLHFGCVRELVVCFAGIYLCEIFWWDIWQKNYGWLLTIWLDFTWMVDKNVLGLVLSNFARLKHIPRSKSHTTSPWINEFSLGVSTKNLYPSDFRSRSCFFWRWGTAAVNACGNAGRWEQALQLVEDLRWDAWDEAVDGKKRNLKANR